MKSKKKYVKGYTRISASSYGAGNGQYRLASHDVRVSAVGNVERTVSDTTVYSSRTR
jgi:hypothetical protein